VPAGSLLITVVRQRNGAGHAVLTVRTSLGDFILDNLENKVLDWTETDYTFLKRQSEQNSGVWVRSTDSRFGGCRQRQVIRNSPVESPHPSPTTGFRSRPLSPGPAPLFFRHAFVQGAGNGSSMRPIAQ
jgi:hypothetical protein